MAKKKGSKVKRSAASAASYLMGGIVDRNIDEALVHSLNFAVAAKKAPWNPKPSARVVCSSKGICTATILCMITVGGDRITCGKTQIFRPECKIKF
jgi:hypothetical protein